MIVGSRSLMFKMITACGHKEGLPSTLVNTIAQTEEGFLWLVPRSLLVASTVRRRDLLLDQRTECAGQAMMRLLRHLEATSLAGLSTNSRGSELNAGHERGKPTTFHPLSHQYCRAQSEPKDRRTARSLHRHKTPGGHSQKPFRHRDKQAQCSPELLKPPELSITWNLTPGSLASR